MASRKLSVDLDEVVEGMDSSHEGYSQWYLDTQTGKVIMVAEELLSDPEDDETEEDLTDDVPEWQRGELELAKQIAGDAEDRFMMIPTADSHEAYRVMEEFIAELRDRHLQEKLQIAISGKGAFRRFKDVLGGVPAVRERWFAFEEERKREWAREWLESLEIETTWQPPKKDKA